MIGMDVGQSIAISNLAALNRLKYSLIDEGSSGGWEHLSFKVVRVKSNQSALSQTILNTVKLSKHLELVRKETVLTGSLSE